MTNRRSDFLMPRDDVADEFSVADPSESAEENLVEALSTAKEADTGKTAEKSDKKDKKDLPKPKYSPEELLQVFDSILIEGEYVEDLSAMNKRVKFTFRSRSAKDASDISRRLDGAEFNLAATYMQYSTLFNLAYSLIHFNGHDLTGMPPMPVKNLKAKPGDTPERTRFDFLLDLPTPMISLLAEKLAEFDDKVFQAFQEGEKNF